MKEELRCPNCGKVVEKYRNPFPTVDIIIEVPSIGTSGKDSCKRDNISGETCSQGPGIVLIRRRNPPHGWALPGGFVDYGESLESAAVREAEEETSLTVELLYQLGAYSDPARDPRHHTISVVFIARGKGMPKAGDDAIESGVFSRNSLPSPIVFDHEKILKDYFTRCNPES